MRALYLKRCVIDDDDTRAIIPGEASLQTVFRIFLQEPEWESMNSTPVYTAIASDMCRV